MAKEKFLSAKRLGVTPKIRQGLIDALRIMDEPMEETYVPGLGRVYRFIKNRFAMYFDMGEQYRKDKECGTVCCIGGLTAACMGMNPKEASNFVMQHDDGRLGDLFYPSNLQQPPAAARKALRAFLTKGRADWS